eukprot:scaffold3258_cov48-Phaeocystis_antarctica.AAC.2
MVGVIPPRDRRGPVDGERVEVDESELAAQRFVVRLVLEDVGLEGGICHGRDANGAGRRRHDGRSRGSWPRRSCGKLAAPPSPARPTPPRLRAVSLGMGGHHYATGSRATAGAREDARRRRPVKRGVPRAMAGVLGAPAFAFAAYRRRATERSAIVRSSYTVTKTLSNSPLWVSLGFAPWFTVLGRKRHPVRGQPHPPEKWRARAESLERPVLS